MKRTLLLLCLGLASCLSRATVNDKRTSVQEWRESRGPVVPHDKFPADCSLCHVPGSWCEIRKDFAFDHEKETGVALNGAHVHAQCLRCHNDRGPVGVFAKRGCAGCHEDVHRGQLGAECVSCHNETSWNPTGIIARHNQTRFPLTGVHTAVACFRCHPAAAAGEFRGVDPRCEVCHREDLKRARQPDHLVLGLTTNCQNCHSGPVWGDGLFTHDGIRAGCAQCHMKEFNATTNPNHAANGFPTACENCHVSTTTWAGARFNHAGITTNCVRCHLNDYNQTTNPNHAAAGYPTTCENCHNTTSWRGATFNHRFDITRGPHKLPCAECHRVPGDMKQASCTHCHAHTQQKMDDKHKNKAGYSWSSPACISCHPTGRGD
jgi:hypothetical protein